MTQAIDLNLSSQPFRNNTLLWIGLIGSSALLLGFTVWNISSYVEHKRLLAEIRDEKNSIASQLVDLERRETQALDFIRAYDLEALTIQADKANEVIGWKAFSWTRLFNRMEVVQPWNVTMRSIQPLFRNDTRDRVGFFTDKSKSVMVAVEGTAKDVDALFKFEQSLFEDPHFAQAEPEEYERASSGEALFSLRFRYYPQARPDLDSEAMAASQTAAGDAADDDGSEEQALDPLDETMEPANGRELPRIQRPPRNDAAPVAAAAGAGPPLATDAVGAVGEPGANAETAAVVPGGASVPAAAAEPAPSESGKVAPAVRPDPAKPRAGVGPARKAGGNRPQRINRPPDPRSEDDGSQEPPGDADDTSEDQAS